MAAAITHVAFYAGWPKAWAVFNLAKEVYGDGRSEETDKDRYQNTIFFPIGDPNDAFAQYFSGQSYLAPVSTEQVPIFNVTFEPGCRNNWHVHHAKSGGGQLLICVGGRGYYQEWGKAPVEMTPGTVVNIPAGVKHWHGAAPDSWFSHLAIEVVGEATSNEWLEPVDDEAYRKAVQGV
jgi:4-carboxymuconolactone decarboxylase